MLERNIVELDAVALRVFETYAHSLFVAVETVDFAETVELCSQRENARSAAGVDYELVRHTV